MQILTEGGGADTPCCVLPAILPSKLRPIESMIAVAFGRVAVTVEIVRKSLLRAEDAIAVDGDAGCQHQISLSVNITK